MCNVSATSLLRFILVSDTNAVSLRNRNNLLNRIFIIRRRLTLSYSNAKFNYASSVYHYLLIITKISTACKLYKLCLYCTKLRNFLLNKILILCPCKIFGFAEMHMGKQSVYATAAACGERRSRFVLPAVLVTHIMLIMCVRGFKTEYARYR